MNDEENKEESEEDRLKSLLRVDDYTEEELEQDLNGVDWDFAYSEILKLEERKKDKYALEAEKKF